MREFGKVGFRLAQLQRDVKWVYTGFLSFVALRFCTNGLFQLTRIGLTLDRIVRLSQNRRLSMFNGAKRLCCFQ